VPQRGHGERVLVVEDEEDLRSVIVELLRAHGFEVDEARTAEDALAKFEARAAVDVLVTDIRLPGISGRALLERVRTTRPRLPVLLMTGYDTRAASPTDKLDDRTALLTKPFGIERLVAEVNQLARVGAH
jgi:CheY-like chemotaxis protein